MSLVEDEEGYRLTADVARTVGKETVVLTGFLRSELSPTGQVYQGIQYAENMGFYRYEFLAGAILGLVLGLLSLGFLLWSAGLRQEGSEEVSLRWMDRAIPTDPADRGGGGSSAAWVSAGGLLQRLGHLPGGLRAHGADHGADGGCAGHGPLPGPPEARGNWEGEPVLPPPDPGRVRRWGKALGAADRGAAGKAAPVLGPPVWASSCCASWRACA